MENNWYIIAGAPSSGKTTIINLLKDKGFNVVHEMARVYIDQKISEGKRIEEIKKDESFFQKEILKLQIKAEKKLIKEKITFLDRGIPDGDAYCALLNISQSNLLKQAIRNSQYKKVFLLDMLNYKKDYARTETVEEQVRIHYLLEES